MTESEWSAKARENAEYHAAALARAQEGQARAGRKLIEDFVGQAQAAGLPTTELTVRPYRGGGRYKTGIQGWYLLPDHSLGVDADANFYILSAPALATGAAARHPAPAEPSPIARRRARWGVDGSAQGLGHAPRSRTHSRLIGDS